MMAKKIARTGIDISARMFYAALVCVSTEEKRYYLKGVHVEPHPEKGAVLVATDGHRMVVLHDEAGYAGRKAIIPADKELIAVLARVTKPADDDARLRVDKDGIVSIEAASYRAAKNTLIDGTFPDWADVIRPVLAAFRRKEVAWASFNPRYLADFGKVADRLAINRDSAIRVAAPDPGSAALILFEGDRSVFGVLMPMRGSANTNTGVPIFMRPILSALRREKRPTLATKRAAKGKPRRRAA